ncbi:MAG TPA: hypothetical protein VHW46_04615 [Terracidiphilus sp.]|jgi:hypothetical protein|nr:hypothetical protein [Terracidiphilus sp.]
MPRLIERLIERIPLPFRVLHRQFLLRVVDLEALSIEADVPRFLGQFAGILIMISCMRAIGTLFFPPPPSMAWATEESALANMLLVVGLIAVVTWDATFPDRRDVLALGHLPVRPRTILLAKVSATAALLGLAMGTLNFASGCSWALVLGGGSLIRSARFFASFWCTIVAATIFLYGAVLTLQGVAALVLPRRLFLKFSAATQLAAFALFMATYFLEPTLSGTGEFADPANHALLVGSPVYWFAALLNQLNGTLPSEESWLAARAWIGLGIALAGASASLTLCYVRTMKKTVEEPDLVPGAAGFHWSPRLGGSLRTAILYFSGRSLLRSRQHRVILAFYWSLALAIALSCLRGEMATPGTISTDFLTSSFVIMAIAVFGLRNVCALPISLNANWVLRVTQLRAPERYFAGTRSLLLLAGVLPAWLVAVLLGVRLRPPAQVAAHLGILLVVGAILVEVALLKFEKVPFTCSYLPGKANVQVVFWGAIFVISMLAITAALYEQKVLYDLQHDIAMFAALVAVEMVLWTVNRKRARSAELYFEEVAPEVITTLGLADGMRYASRAEE